MADPTYLYARAAPTRFCRRPVGPLMKNRPAILLRRVYGPDIKTAGERLFKRPGYGPLAAPPEE